MKKLFFNVFGVSLTIIGSVIGAGFITGKEIQVFFCNDLSLSGIYCSLIFFFAYILLLSFSPDGFTFKVVKTLIALLGIIIASCMTAALNAFFEELFPKMKNFKILTIITVIFAIFISCKGITSMKIFSSFAVPIVVICVVIFSAIFKKPIDIPLSPLSDKGRFYPMLYVGINCLLSSMVITDSCGKLSSKEKVLVSFVVSLSLGMCIACISVCVIGERGDMPFLNVVRVNPVLSVFSAIMTFISIFTSLVTAVYSAFSVTKGKTSVLRKITISLVFFMLSAYGFSGFIEKIYPIIGIFGFAYFVFIALSLIFRKERQGRTLRPQGDTKLPSMPLRGRA